MTRYDARLRALAICLSALAGYVDALGFLQLNGFFVSFMSGNSTRLGVGLARSPMAAGVAALLIAAFVTGVVAGALVGRRTKARRRSAVLALVSASLGLAAFLAMNNYSSCAIAAMAFSMGAENAVFERDGELHIGLTYMTGTLVKLGQRLAATLSGGDRLGWGPYLLLWLGMVSGAMAGALTYPRWGLGGLWGAACGAALLAVAATFSWD